MARKHWWDRVKRYDPPECAVRSVYDLDGAASGRVVVIAAPGPSFAEFPVDVLERARFTIACNAALELFRPWAWIGQEGTLIKKYHELYAGDRVVNIVTTETRTKIIKHVLPAGKTVYCYDTGPSLKERQLSATPVWWWPQRNFLPGRSTIAANALSLAELMRPRACLLVGVDFAYSNDDYYAAGVVRNPGPRLRAKALGAGRAWCQYALSWRAWRGLDLYTTSTRLRLGRRFKRISVSDAVDMIEEGGQHA